MFDSLQHLDHSPPGSSVLGDSPGKNIGMGCHAVLQGIFLTQEMNCPPGDLPDPGNELRSCTLPPDSLPVELPGKQEINLLEEIKEIQITNGTDRLF